MGKPAAAVAVDSLRDGVPQGGPARCHDCLHSIRYAVQQHVPLRGQAEEQVRLLVPRPELFNELPHGLRDPWVHLQANKLSQDRLEQAARSIVCTQRSKGGRIGTCSGLLLLRCAHGRRLLPWLAWALGT